MPQHLLWRFHLILICSKAGQSVLPCQVRALSQNATGPMAQLWHLHSSQSRARQPSCISQGQVCCPQIIDGGMTAASIMLAVQQYLMAPWGQPPIITADHEGSPRDWMEPCRALSESKAWVMLHRQCHNITLCRPTAAAALQDNLLSAWSSAALRLSSPSANVCWQKPALDGCHRQALPQ